MRVAWMIITSSIAFALIEAKPRKQKRMVEVVSRQFLERHENEDVFSDDDVMKRKFKKMMESLPRDLRLRAMRELLHMFGLEVPNNLESSQNTKKPPKYMVDLYNAIADHNGITRAPDLLDADTVRSIPNKDSRCPARCYFDLRPLAGQEAILDAELHVFIERPTTKSNIKPTSYFVNIYQVVSESTSSGKLRKTLVAARRIPYHIYGWQIFPLLTPVESWSSERLENLGIVIETSLANGDVIEQRSSVQGKQPILVMFTNDSKSVINISKKTKTLQLLHNAKLSEMKNSNNQPVNGESRHKRAVDDVTEEKTRRKHHGGKSEKRRNRKEKAKSGKSDQTEVVKTSVGKRNNRTSENKTSTEGGDVTHMSFDDKYESNYDDKEAEEFYFDESDFWEEYDYDYASDSGTSKSSSQSRQPVGQSTARFPSFSTLSTEASAMRSCRRYPLYVDFEEMGWSGWIIHPQGYNAYHCRGQCAFPLGQNLKPSNHATVQSIMHTLGLGGQPVDMPCCTPEKLYDINLLYFDHNDYVVLRRYKDMVAASCACR